jgi:hypothetical protein
VQGDVVGDGSSELTEVGLVPVVELGEAQLSGGRIEAQPAIVRVDVASLVRELLLQARAGIEILSSRI